MTLMRRSLLLFAAIALLCAPGCFGVTENPSYFPYLLPFGDVIQTHAKPPGHGYFANFDPHAIRLEIRPLEATNQVRTQHVIIATVFDEDNQPRRSRRVEWMLEGVGNIIEVDESGYFPGRGYKATNKYAVSYTSSSEDRISRGTGDPKDDFVIRPGQTWCVISSAVEGDSYMTAYAPGINNWEKGRVVVNARWVDATWEFPPPATVKFGTEHVFTTKVFRHTDHQPLANYRVRYKITDGPAAALLPSQTTEYIAVSDLNGNAQVAIRQITPTSGVNHVSVEIIRPPDPNAPSGAGIPIAKGETSVQWLAPNVTFNHTGPPLAVLGQDATYTITAVNGGSVESQSMTVTSNVPDGLQFVRSTPPAFVQGNQLTYALGLLAPSATHTIQAVYKAVKPGPVNVCADLQTAEGQKDEKCVTTQVVTAALKVAIVGPQTGVVGVPLTYQITVSNPGNGPLDNVALTAQLDEGLEESTSKAKVLNTGVGTLAPQESKTITLTAIPRVQGRLGAKVIATSSTLSESAETFVVVSQPQMNVSLSGPSKRYQGRPADFSIRVSNPSDAPLSNVMVHDRLPVELSFVSATQQGQFANGEVVWNLGTLQGREERVLTFSANCAAQTKAAMQTASATADGNLRKDAQASLEIYGLPGLRLEVIDRGDPVEVGKKVTYVIDVSNTGTLVANGIELQAIVPPELRVTPADIRGPLRNNIAGQVITFDKIDNLQPGQKATIEIDAEGMRPKDVRFRVEMRAPILEGGPVIEEESTTIAGAPQQGLPPAPPPINGT